MNPKKTLNLQSWYAKENRGFVLHDKPGQPAQAWGRTASGLPINVDYVGGSLKRWYGHREDLDAHLAELQKKAEEQAGFLEALTGQKPSGIEVVVVPEGMLVTPKQGVVVVQEAFRKKQTCGLELNLEKQ